MKPRVSDISKNTFYQKHTVTVFPWQRHLQHDNKQAPAHPQFSICYLQNLWNPAKFSENLNLYILVSMESA